jgi:hypothetical protein
MLDFETLFEMKPSAKTITVYPPGTALPQPFAFVLNVSGLVGCDKLEIVPGCILRRGNGKEIKFTKKVIASLFGEHFGGTLWETRRPKSGQGRHVKLLAKQWR